MLRHKVLHDKGSFKCERCAREFVAQHHMAAHKCWVRPAGRRRSAAGQLPCQICSLTCSTPAAWGFHMWRHTKDPKYLPDFSGGGLAAAATPPSPGAEERTGPHPSGAERAEPSVDGEGRTERTPHVGGRTAPGGDCGEEAKLDPEREDRMGLDPGPGSARLCPEQMAARS
ncbi:B-cell lymphoma/leukemia 11B-like [Pollicipes pollicipes]|uniref:B-cell lymphoma/leukemia 11B-like n=1 Tax=Pollicipes pollicipes TaxID=41117 RepID=UPI0018857710|nr:B-cell lymphoma/leukemia 11B-like [Pollicipes pollicipes]